MTAHARTDRGHHWALGLFACSMLFLPALSTAARADVAGSWEGTYVCPQGETAARLDLARASGQAWRGTFTFGSMPGRTNARAGVFAVRGHYDSAARRLVVMANGWIDRPPDYEEIDFTVTLDTSGQSLSGTINHPDCSTIVLQRRMTS